MRVARIPEPMDARSYRNPRSKAAGTLNLHMLDMLVWLSARPGSRGSSSMLRWKAALRLQSRRPRSRSKCMTLKVVASGLHNRLNYFDTRERCMTVQPMVGCTTRHWAGCNRRSTGRGRRQRSTLARRRARSTAASSPMADTSALSVCLHQDLFYGASDVPNLPAVE